MEIRILGKIVAIFLIFSTFVSMIPAMPPHPSVMDKVDVELLRKFHILPIEETDLKVAVEKVGNLAILKPSRSYTGTIRGIMLLVDFPDKPHIVDESYFEDLVNSLGLNWSVKYPGNTNVGSVREYYRWMSNGEIDMVIDVAGWFTLPNTYDYYVRDDYGFSMAWKLVQDAVDCADPSVDFSRYDNDGDGYVDMLIVVHAGKGAELTGDKNDIWSHESSITPKLVDGVRVKNYAMTPEYWFEKDDMTIGVYCHEMGHVFGLIDLYDIDSSSFGLGKWSLMAYGAWNGPPGPDGKPLGGGPAGLDAWSKLMMGWFDVEVGGNQTDFILEPVMDSKRIIALYKNGNTSLREYFLMENRGHDGFDQYIPGYGLLIYHIDEDKGGNTQEWYPGMDPSKHYKVALVQADGRWDLEMKQNSGDDGDPYPGSSNNRNFRHDTMPSSDYYFGSSNISVENIRNLQEDIIFDLKLTQENLPPSKPSSPYPPDKSTVNPRDVVLSWECEDPDGDILSFDLYFGEKGKMELIASDYGNKSYDVGDLDEGKEYEWKVIAKDGRGGESEGDTWTFRTSYLDNTPPSIRPIRIFDHVLAGSPTTFIFEITDDSPVDVSLSCSSTCTYNYNDDKLFVHFTPAFERFLLSIIATDSNGNKSSWSREIKSFHYAILKPKFEDSSLLIIFEYGFEESPGTGFSSESGGVYWKTFKDGISIFDEYTIHEDGGLKVGENR